MPEIWPPTPSSFFVQDTRTLRSTALSAAIRPVIDREMGLPVSTVELELHSLALDQLRALDPKPAIIRYEREHLLAGS